jgi:hypothetical protein
MSKGFWAVQAGSMALVASALVLLLSKDYDGHYEVSIYSSNMPTAFWPLLLLGMAGAIFLLVWQVRSESGTRLWLFPLGVLLLVNAIILLLPIIKEYYCANRHDSLMHIGFVKDLLWHGEFVAHNTYPGLHILPVILSFITGMSPEASTNAMPAIFSTLYIILIYFLAKGVFVERGKIILATILGTILMMPHAWSMQSTPIIAMLYPLVLLLGLKSGESHRAQLFFILLLVIAPLFHPMMVFMSILALALAWILHRKQMGITFPVCALVAAALMYLAWFKGNAVSSMPVQVIREVFAGEQLLSPVHHAGDLLQKGGVSGAGIGLVILKLYGSEVFFGIFGGLGALVVFRNYGKSDTKMRFLALLYVALGLFFLLYLANLSQTAERFLSRSMEFIPVVSIMLTTPLLYGFLKQARYPALIIGGVALLLAASAASSVFAKYPSPYTYQPNPQATHGEITGAEWLATHGENLLTMHLGTPLGKYLVAAYGTSWVFGEQQGVVFRPSEREMETTHWDAYSEGDIRMPDHFGYDKGYKTIGEFVDRPYYLIVTKHDELRYEEAWKPPIPTRWGKEDFDRLSQDEYVRLEYSNPDFTVYKIYPAID